LARAYSRAVRVEHTDLAAVNELVELLELLVFRRLVVVLFGNRGVGLGVDLFGIQSFRHFQGCSGTDGTVSFAKHVELRERESAGPS